MSALRVGLLFETSSRNRPGQIAAALLWGTALGILPKDSLLFPLMLLTGVCLPFHLAACLSCAAIVSCAAPLLHPWLGNFGHGVFQMLGWSWIEKLDRYPLIPWLKLHNTVVIGALAITAICYGPLYLLLQRLLAPSYFAWFAARLQASKAPTLEVGRSAIGSAKVPLPEIAPEVCPQPLATALPLAAELDRFDQTLSRLSHSQIRGDSHQVGLSVAQAIDSVHAIESLLEQANDDSSAALDARAVLARATRASQLVDEILQSLDALEAGSQHTEQTHSLDDQTAAVSPSTAQSPQQPMRGIRVDLPKPFELHDTKISIYRRARTGETTVSTRGERSNSPEKESMATVRDAAESSASFQSLHAASSGRPTGNRSASDLSPSANLITRENPPHEEALRHLLDHLRTLKDKV